MTKQAEMKENRLVVGDSNWAKDIPDFLLEKVKKERILLGLVSIANPDIEKIGDAEVLCYLFPASLRAPLTHRHTQIYLYLFTKVFENSGKSVPLDIRVTELSSDEERELRELRYMIYQKRGGEIHHPLLDAVRTVAKAAKKKAKKRRGK